MKVTSENYVELATKTEAPITVEMINRIKKSIPELLLLMQKQIELGNKIDILKKYMYYGKGNCNLGFTPVDKQVEDRIINNDIIRLLHCSLGLTTESTEIFEALQNFIVYGENLDTINLMEEFGDCDWYKAIGLSTIKKTMNETLQVNIEKLVVRYPDNFTEHHAISRDLEKEREILTNI